MDDYYERVTKKAKTTNGSSHTNKQTRLAQKPVVQTPANPVASTNGGAVDTNNNSSIAEKSDTNTNLNTLPDVNNTAKKNNDLNNNSDITNKLLPVTSRQNLFIYLMPIVVIVISVVCSIGAVKWYLSSGQASTTTNQQKLIISQNDELIANIAKDTSPSVVSIVTKQISSNSLLGSNVEQGAGSGIIVSSDGLVLTNKHVVPVGTASVNTILSDGTIKKADVVARDPLNDIALVQIKDTSNLKAVKLGDSSKMKVGDTVIAIGNALGQYQNTVTTGIISGLGRPVVAQQDGGGGSEALQDLFQTDAAINPGNSGGPLVNINSEVIGINTAMASEAQNIGFAIPINVVKASVESYKKEGKIIQPYLGVKYIPLTPSISKQLELEVDYGAYIGGSDRVGVVAGSPADRAGVKKGDIITKVNDSKIDASHSLATLIAQYRPSDKVTLSVQRDGKNLSINVSLGEVPTNISD